MNNEKPKIKIFDPKEDIATKFDFYIKIVIAVLVVSMLTMLFMVSGLLLDALHFNSVTYKECSEKTQTIDNTLKINQELLDQNQKNQQIIIDLLK